MSHRTKFDYDDWDPVAYDNQWRDSYRNSYLLNHWRPLVIREIKSSFAGRVVVDLGCGVGFYTAEIAKVSKSVVGIDISRRHLEYARDHYHVKVVQGDAQDTKLSAHHFDGVYLMGLVEYVSMVDLINEIDRLTKPGSIIIMGIPNYYSAHRMCLRILSRIFGWSYPQRDVRIGDLTRELGHHNISIDKVIMNDGLVYLPNILDRTIGQYVYPLIEAIYNLFNASNPFSNMAIIVAKKD